MCKNIQSEELLDELIARVKVGEIKVNSNYFYDREKLEISFESADAGIIFSSDWDAKQVAKYREYYETYCLPLLNQQEEKKYKQKVVEFQKDSKNKFKNKYITL